MCVFTSIEVIHRSSLDWVVWTVLSAEGGGSEVQQGRPGSRGDCMVMTGRCVSPTELISGLLNLTTTLKKEHMCQIGVLLCFTPPSSKQNHPTKEESNFKTITPKSTNSTPAAHCPPHRHHPLPH